MRQSWITSIKLGIPKVKLGGPGSNQVALSQFKWSWFKSIGPELNQSVLSQNGGHTLNVAVLDQLGSPGSN